MTRISELRSAEAVHEQNLCEPAYAAEHERTRFANEVAVQVLRYRDQHKLSQSAFGRLVGLRQPHVARLEAADHEPSLSTLARLSEALGMDFTIDVHAGEVHVRATA